MNRERGEVKEYRVGNLVLLSTKDLKYQMARRHTEKFMERFVGSYKVKVIISSNAIKLELPSMVKIYPVVNVSQVQQYKLQIEGQKKKTPQWERERIGSREDYEQEKSMRKVQVLGVMERMHSGRRYMGE